MMNIGIVTTWFDRGAAYVSKAYMDVLSHDNNVFIYARGGEVDSRGDPNWDKPNVTYGKRYKPLDAKYQIFTNYKAQHINMLHFEAWLRNNNINVVIFNEEHLFYTVKRTKDLGYTVGAYIDYYKKDTVDIFRVYDFLLCNTKRHYSVFSDFGNTLYIPWGTDINVFAPKINDIIENEQKTLIFFHSAGFGGINFRKGTDLLVKAFQQVHGNCKLIIHSQVPLAQYGDEIEKLIGADLRIDFVEKTVPAPGLYHLGDVYVYPTRLEGIGLSIAEALACGLPVITTDSAPMNEFVEDGINGLLVSVAQTITRQDNYYWPQTIVSVDDLAHTMQRYVDDRNLFLSHHKNARISAETKLNWNNNAEHLTDILSQLVNEVPKTKSSPGFLKTLLWGTESFYLTILTWVRLVLHKIFR